MAEGIVSDMASKALELAAKTAVKKAASWWCARDDLKKLKQTIRMIQARVRDAERRQEEETSDAIKEWLRTVKMVLYQADDLFDEVLYLDRQKQHQMEKTQKSMLRKVGILFSKYGTLYVNRKVANEIKSIRIQLDAIKEDMNSLPLSNLPAEERPLDRLIKKRETASFVDAEDVIGREDDQNRIVDMLFNPNYERGNITVVSIVGFGGLGKTTLARLVFNHLKNDEQRFDLTAWVYVPEIGDKKVIMGKIMNSFTGGSYQVLQLEEIIKRITESMASKKYLLVLDDLWDDEPDTLNELLDLLKCGKHGSKVIVTTRSQQIAEIVGTPYQLGNLSDDKSWELFNKLVFKPGQEHINKPALFKIGEEIVKLCGNMPLAIKAVAGILSYKHTENEWLRVRNTQRSKAQQMEGRQGDIVMATLKLSYDYLTPELKQCFGCSLFRKGHRFDKDNLVQL